MRETGLRVLMTTDAVGGVFVYSLDLARELAQRGMSVALAIMGPPMRASQRSAASSIPGVTIHESTFALEWEDEPWDDVTRAGEWLLDLENALEPDVVHLNGYCHGALDFRAPAVVAGHSCVLSWWEAVYGSPAPERYAAYRERVRRGLAAASAVIAPTIAMLDALERHYMRLPHASVIANGSNAAPAKATKEPFVLAAGRVWDKAKNIEAVARVAPHLPWPVKVAGAEDLPHVENLGWLGSDALGRVMERASIFALPARYEPFGLSALEAALRGCALVLGDIASLREVWGDAALYVPPEDDDALAEAVTQLTRDESARDDLATRARARASTFTVEANAAATLAVYTSVLARGAASCA